MFLRWKSIWLFKYLPFARCIARSCSFRRKEVTVIDAVLLGIIECLPLCRLTCRKENRPKNQSTWALSWWTNDTKSNHVIEFDTMHVSQPVDKPVDFFFNFDFPHIFSISGDVLQDLTEWFLLVPFRTKAFEVIKPDGCLINEHRCSFGWCAADGIVSFPIFPPFRQTNDGLLIYRTNIVVCLRWWCLTFCLIFYLAMDCYLGVNRNGIFAQISH